MATRTPRRNLLLICLMLLAVPTLGRAASPSPLATVPTLVASPSATAPTTTTTPARPTATATVRSLPTPTPTAGRSAEAEAEPEAPADPYDDVVATTVPPRPRAFRTPERAAAPVFMAPEGAGPGASAPDAPASDHAPMPAAPAARGGTGLVVFRVTARTAVEGFDLRVTYPRTLGAFATSGQQADCNAGTGTLVVASDRGAGELRLLVASGQALPLPLDVFCRFALTAGSGLEARSFDVRVAEVTSNAMRADSGLLIVNVVVR